MKKFLMLTMILVLAIELLSFSEPVAIDDNLNGELVVNYEKNVKEVDGKLWILYYDVAIHPLPTYLKLAREQEDGSFEVMQLCNMNIAVGVRVHLDCTFAVQGEEVTIFYKKTFSNIEDLRVFKIHSSNMMENYNEIIFSSQYDKIINMSLELTEDELVLVLLRGDQVGIAGINSLYYEYRNGGEFAGRDVLDGAVYSKDDIYIHQTAQGNNNGWPTFNDLVVCEDRIMNASTGAPAVYSAPMDDIFRGGYVEGTSTSYTLPANAAENWNGFLLDSSSDRDMMYARIDGTTATCKYANYVTRLDTVTVYNSFPDAEHPELAVGDSIWTNIVEIKELDWDDGTFNITLNNSSVVCFCPLWIEGEVYGSMTIVSTDTIYVIGDLTYASVPVGTEPEYCNDYFGLVSGKSIVVKYRNFNPFEWMMQSDNLDGIYIYGVLAALGEVGADPNNILSAGNLQVEYLHPHGSTPAYELAGEIHPYPDLHKFVYYDTGNFLGDEGFIMHSNEMPAGFPCCGFPYENEDYGNGIISPYGTDFPWYNPVYPESSIDIVFDRGEIELYGALIERGFHNVYCSGNVGTAHIPGNAWQPEYGLYGGTHAACGYELNIHYDERLLYQNQFPPGLNNLMESPDHNITILHSTNGGDSFVQRYNQNMAGSGLYFTQDLKTVQEDGLVALLYKTLEEYRLDYWDTSSFGMSMHMLSYEDITGDIRALRLYNEELYFQDDAEIYKLQNDNLYPLADLLISDFYGYSYDYSDRIMWSANRQSYHLDFTFYGADEYWDFDEIGESTYEYGYEVDIFNLEDIYLKVSDQVEAQLFLHGREYNEDMFYLACDQLEALSAEPNEIDDMLNLKIYPNPIFGKSTRADCRISYAIPAQQSGEISIYNVKGQCLNKWKITGSGEIAPDVSGYGSGIYLMRLKSDKGQIERKLSVIK
ncbi:MAG: T9SS type A sorting domain-containing protein [Candidatus Cloacimonetes bacterium]|nr:T9SS type A sorting domain-containing protein [Candidatus Cloacimonadota bacterium]